MRILEGDQAARPDVWIRAGLLSPRPGFRLSFSRRDVEKLRQHLSDLVTRGPRLDRRTPFADLPSELIERKAAYSKLRLLQDIFSGNLSIFSPVESPSLGDIWLCEDEIEARSVVIKLEKMLAENAYERLAKINPELVKLWGPMASIDATEAHQYLALGRIRHRIENVKYKEANVPRYRYHVGDIIELTQSIFLPKYFHPSANISAETPITD
jgi:hypothetical protein